MSLHYYKFTVLTSKQGRGCHFMCWKQNQSQSKKKPTLRSKAHPPAMGDSMCTGKGGSWQRGPPSQVSNSTGIDETWRHRHLPCSFSRRQLRWNMGNVFILGCKSSVILRSCQRLPISPHSCSLTWWAESSGATTSHSDIDRPTRWKSVSGGVQFRRSCFHVGFSLLFPLLHLSFFFVPYKFLLKAHITPVLNS